MMWLTLLLAIILQVSQVCVACPVDYMKRELKGVTTCCKTTICVPGEGYRLCNGSITAPGEDECYNCSIGTYNKDRINTSEMYDQLNVCAQLDCKCPEGTIISNYESCMKGIDKVCVCDRKNLYFGWDPKACEMIGDNETISRIKNPGFELNNNGKVERCPQGYFKSEADLSTCEPHTECPAEDGLKVKDEGTAISDTVCENTTDIQPNEPESPVEAQGIHVHVIVIIASILAAVIIGVCIICLFPRHSRSLAGKFRGFIRKVKQSQQTPNLGDDNSSDPLRDNTDIESQPEYLEANENIPVADQRSRTDLLELSSQPSITRLQNDCDDSTSDIQDF